ncbi:MAG: lysophospholipid acyltransferase family protein [Dehalococcoidales bacterium]|nr:lysophospholipid acyltransferase family protein [Dehalococcoidales bacterium]
MFFNIFKLMLRTILRLLFRWRIQGKESIPGQGPLLVVANHVNLIDPVLLGAGFDRRLIFMAKKELFRFRLIGYFLNWLGAFSVHRGQVDREALFQAENVLNEGQALFIFPEGRRSHNGRLQIGYPGSARIALHNNVPVLPVGIIGTGKIKGVGWILKRPEITLKIGQPFHLPTNGKVSRQELTESTNTIMEHIAELLPLEYRGYYARQKELDNIES